MGRWRVVRAERSALAPCVLFWVGWRVLRRLGGVVSGVDGILIKFTVLVSCGRLHWIEILLIKLPLRVLRRQILENDRDHLVDTNLWAVLALLRDLWGLTLDYEIFGGDRFWVWNRWFWAVCWELFGKLVCQVSFKVLFGNDLACFVSIQKWAWDLLVLFNDPIIHVVLVDHLLRAMGPYRRMLIHWYFCV